MIDWDIPFTLTSPEDDLIFNEPTTSPYTSDSGYLFLLNHEECTATPGPIRQTIDPISQADGSIIHPAFKNGFHLSLTVQLWVDLGDGTREPACYTDRRVMWDTLLLHLNSMLNPSLADLFSNCRLRWQPAGYADERMFTRLRLVDWPTVTDRGGIASVTFGLATEFPYLIDKTEDPPDAIDALLTTTPTVYTNIGTSEDFPVFRVQAINATLHSFIIENGTTGQQIVYDDSLPGAVGITVGNYVEIDTFRNTVYLNGSGANLKPGIDITLSDFWSLRPGDNSLSWIWGGGLPSCLMLWNYAWAG